MMTRNYFQTFIFALAITLASTMGSTAVSAQKTADTRREDAASANNLNFGNGPSIVGVWEQVDVPLETDCATGKPMAGTPNIRIMQTYNEGGTGWQEDTFPGEGPYRSTGSTLWRRTSKLGYMYTNRHYSFLPDNTFIFLVTTRGYVELRPDGNAYNERGTFQLSTPDGTVVYTGCFNSTANRLGLY